MADRDHAEAEAGRVSASGPGSRSNYFRTESSEVIALRQPDRARARAFRGIAGVSGGSIFKRSRQNRR